MSIGKSSPRTIFCIILSFLSFLTLVQKYQEKIRQSFSKAIKATIGNMLVGVQRPTHLQNWKGGIIVGFFSGQRGLAKIETS